MKDKLFAEPTLQYSLAAAGICPVISRKNLANTAL